jgi:hypothetical protein
MSWNAVVDDCKKNRIVIRAESVENWKEWSERDIVHDLSEPAFLFWVPEKSSQGYMIALDENDYNDFYTVPFADVTKFELPKERYYNDVQTLVPSELLDISKLDFSSPECCKTHTCVNFRGIYRKREMENPLVIYSLIHQVSSKENAKIMKVFKPLLYGEPNFNGELESSKIPVLKGRLLTYSEEVHKYITWGVWDYGKRKEKRYQIQSSFGEIVNPGTTEPTYLDAPFLGDKKDLKQALKDVRTKIFVRAYADKTLDLLGVE